MKVSTKRALVQIAIAVIAIVFNSLLYCFILYKFGAVSFFISFAAYATYMLSRISANTEIFIENEDEDNKESN